ncbi:MAG: PAS domain-containing protein, partial [Cyanobacteria bacterium J06650_10]
MHRLLARQLQRHLNKTDSQKTDPQKTDPSLEEILESAGLAEDWAAFLAAVDSTYEQADTDRYRLEHIALQTSQELLALNSQMKAAIPDTFLRLDKQSMILEYKPGQSQQAYLSSSDVVGKPLKRFLPAEAAEKFVDAIAKLEMHAAGEVSIFHRLTRDDGGAEMPSDRFYEVRVLPFLDDQVVAIVRDITERKQAEKALQMSQQKLREKTHRLASALADLKDTQTQLVQTEKMSGLGQLVAGIAHEINNPVNFVSGNISHIQSYVE